MDDGNGGSNKNYCEACPAGSTSSDGSSTTCTCEANKYAKNNKCANCGANTFRTGSWFPGANENKNEVCLEKSCAANQYIKDGACTNCAEGSTSAGGKATTCTPNCASGKYWDGDSCETCPGNSVGAGGKATSCTCNEKYYAKLTGDTWSCETCPTDSTKIGSVVPHTSGKSDTCVSSCASGKYWDGSACQACPANSNGVGGAEASCTCNNNYRAVVSAGTWTCEECSGRQGSKIPQPGGESDECVASQACTTRQYFDGKAKACKTCPDGSTSEGGTAEFCTCGENMYAVKSGNSWKCVECTGGGTKAANSQVPGSGNGQKESEVCSAASSCKENFFLSGGKCETCPANSVSSGGTATDCTCLDDFYAAYSSSKGGTYTCNKCTGKSGSAIPRSDKSSDTCDNIETGKSCTARAMVPKNGYFGVIDCPATVEHGVSCAVECARGYAVGSPPVSTCDDGKVTLATCEAATCAENEYVLYGVCTACPAGSVNVAGDKASGDNTNCECPVNTYRVVAGRRRLVVRTLRRRSDSRRQRRRAVRRDAAGRQHAVRRGRDVLRRVFGVHGRGEDRMHRVLGRVHPLRHGMRQRLPRHDFAGGA